MNLYSVFEFLCRLNVKKKFVWSECWICRNDRPVIVSECGHCACIQCFEQMSKCPVCRESIDPSKLMHLKNAAEVGRNVFP